MSTSSGSIVSIRVSSIASFDESLARGPGVHSDLCPEQFVAHNAFVRRVWASSTSSK